MKKIILSTMMVFSTFAFASYHSTSKTGMGLTLPQHTGVPQSLEKFCYDSNSDTLRGKKPVFNYKLIGSPNNGSHVNELVGYEDVEFPRRDFVTVQICGNNSCHTEVEVFSYKLSGVEKTLGWNNQRTHSKVISKRNWTVKNCVSTKKY